MIRRDKSEDWEGESRQLMLLIISSSFCVCFARKSRLPVTPCESIICPTGLPSRRHRFLSNKELCFFSCSSTVANRGLRFAEKAEIEGVSIRLSETDGSETNTDTSPGKKIREGESFNQEINVLLLDSIFETLFSFCDGIITGYCTKLMLPCDIKRLQQQQQSTFWWLIFLLSQQKIDSNEAWIGSGNKLLAKTYHVLTSMRQEIRGSRDQRQIERREPWFRKRGFEAQGEQIDGSSV